MFPSTRNSRDSSKASANSRSKGTGPLPQPIPALCPLPSAPCPRSRPHLCGPAHGGSSHPSLSCGPGCPGLRVPTAPSCSLSPGGSLEAGGLMGGVATGPGGHAWHGRGAAPGAAVAAMKLVVSTAEQKRAGESHRLPSCGSRGKGPSKPLSPAQATCCLAKGSLLMDCNLDTRFMSSTLHLSPPPNSG